MNISTLRREYKAQEAWGLLSSIDLAGCDHKMIQSPKAMKGFIKQLVKLLKMKAYGPTRIEKFAEDSLEGYSVFQFIETSSIIIHFDDKSGDRAFIDVFSCCFFDPYAAEIFSKKYFKAKSSKMKLLLRY